VSRGHDQPLPVTVPLPPDPLAPDPLPLEPPLLVPLPLEPLPLEPPPLDGEDAGVVWVEAGGV
jgi:hypothetical protein